MAYLTYEEYNAYGANDLNSAEFDRLLFEAERVVDYVTSGVDNVRKLEVAFPTAARDSEIVKRCIATLIDEIKLSDDIAAQVAAGLTSGNGIHSGVINSVSSGSESISYAALPATFTQDAYDKTARDTRLKSDAMYMLRGTQDKNGVNLLYGGAYPLPLTGV